MSKHIETEPAADAGFVAGLAAVLALAAGWLAALGILVCGGRIGLLPPGYSIWQPVFVTAAAAQWLASIGGPLPGILTRLAGLPDWLDFSAAFAVACSATAAWIVYRSMQIPVERHVGGARVRERGRRKGGGIALSKDFVVSLSEEVQHFLFLAGSGGGKSTLIRRVIRQAIGRGDRLLILDYKRDYTQTLVPGQGGVTLIAPWDSRSHRWLIGEDLQTIVARDEFLRAAIPDGRDPQWARGARNIAEAIMAALVVECGAKWGFGDLVASLAAALVDLQALRGIAATYGPETLLSIDTSPATRASFLTNVGQALSDLSRIAAAESLLPPSRTWSVSSWMSQPGGVAIVGWLPEGVAFSRSFALPAIQTAIISILSKPDVSPSSSDPKQRSWLVLDEIGQVGHVPALTSGLTAIRSKGGRIVIGLQSLAQVEEHYGKASLTTWLGQTATKVISRVEAPGDQEIVQHLIGKSQIERRHVTNSRDGGRSESWQRHEESAILGHELAQLGPRSNGEASDVLILRGGETWQQVVEPDTTESAHAPALVGTAFLRAGYTRPHPRTFGHVIDLERLRALAPEHSDVPKN